MLNYVCIITAYQIDYDRVAIVSMPRVRERINDHSIDGRASSTARCALATRRACSHRHVTSQRFNLQLSNGPRTNHHGHGHCLPDFDDYELGVAAKCRS